MPEIPSHLQYTQEHEWLDVDDGQVATVGITAVATAALGDVVYINLPDVGSKVEAGTACGEIESTKSVTDLYSPATGEVLDVNQAALDEPALVNTDPYGTGWLFRVRLEDTPDLMSADEYTSFTDVDGGLS